MRRHPQPANLLCTLEASGETWGHSGKQRQDSVSDESEDKVPEAERQLLEVKAIKV